MSTVEGSAAEPDIDVPVGGGDRDLMP